jgi:hypothetical protein
MGNSSLEERGKLRLIIAKIERELALPATGAVTDVMRASWSELVGVLALGPEPETRECPTCKGVGMRGASRCGQCWAKLEPLPLISKDAQHRGETHENPTAL